MIDLVLSPHLDLLLDALARDIARLRNERGPFEEVWIGVPGPATTAYIKQGLAARLGIFAHARVGSVRSLLSALSPRPLVGPRGLALGLLDALGQPELWAQAALAPLARYLGVAEDTPQATAVRRVQLTDALGPLFDAYALHRPDWLQAWRRGEPSEREDERWQAELYRHLRSAGLFAAEDGPVPFAEGLLDLDLDRAPAALHLFDVPLDSPALARGLERLATRSAIHLYASTPCVEFWEDLPGRARGSELQAEPDPAALRLWGRPGREAVRTASALAGEVDVQIAEAPPPQTVLSAFQADVRHRRRAEAPRAPDDSVLVVEAPGIRRECESIAEEIWTLVERYHLNWTDIVVALSSDADVYRSQLAAAFAEAGPLPFHELDVALAANSPVMDAVRLLLELPGSTFTRQDVLRVATHPNVRAKHGGGDIQAWLPWVDALAILRGRDHEAHADTYIERDLFNWDQGLRRLALGAFLPEADPPGPVQVGPHLLVPAAAGADDPVATGHFLVVMRALLADAESLRTARLRLPEWARYLRCVVDTHLAPENDDDERDLHRVHGVLAELAELDGRAELDFPTVSRWVTDRLAGLRVHRGQPLAEAVVLAPLREVAHLPFRVAFMPGLGEGRFPASERRHALDLRRHRPGPEATPRERDEYAFLMRVMATSDVLRLSYVARDLASGDELLPASTLVEFEEILDGYVEGPVPRRKLPVLRHEAPGRNPRARAEAAADALGLALGREALRPQSSLPPERRAALARRLGIETPPAPAEDRGRPRIKLGALRRFLEDPAQGWAQHALGLGDREAEEAISRASEPFTLTPQLNLHILREVFLAWLDEGAPAEELPPRYRNEAERMELLGALPTGVFGEAVRDRHLACLEAWRLRLLEATEGKPLQSLHRIEYGGRGGAVASLVRPPLELERALLVGATEATFEDGGSVVFVDRELGGRAAQLKTALRGWLAQLTWLASTENVLETPWPGLVADRGPRLLRTRFAPRERADALQILSGLTGELLGRAHAYRLPFETQLRLHDARRKGQRGAMLRDLLERAPSSPFGPVDTKRFSAPSVDEALDIVDRRLGPFLNAVREEGR